MMEEAQSLAASKDTYFTDQFHNADMLKGYEKLGMEILAQVEQPIHAFCAGVGTAGMLMGVAHALRGVDSRAKIVVLEPASSPVISTGTPLSFRVGAGIFRDRVIINDAYVTKFPIWYHPNMSG